MISAGPRLIAIRSHDFAHDFQEVTPTVIRPNHKGNIMSLKYIAGRAGVSASTVSNVVNRKPAGWRRSTCSARGIVSSGMSATCWRKALLKKDCFSATSWNALAERSSRWLAMGCWRRIAGEPSRIWIVSAGRSVCCWRDRSELPRCSRPAPVCFIPVGNHKPHRLPFSIPVFPVWSSIVRTHLIE